MRSETSVVRDVILPEGTTLRLRAATSDDADGLVAFVERMTPESRYFRFHGLPPVGPADARTLKNPIGYLLQNPEHQINAHTVNDQVAHGQRRRSSLAPV